MKPILAFLFLLSVLTSCDSSAPSSQAQPPVAIEESDECHLCGMLIKKFPGPKGEIYQRGQTQAQKFCSTRDLFSHFLQPENRSMVESIYVHDMAVSPWEKPDDSHLIDARAAWYVINHPKTGAMGATLASFKHRQDAESFIKQVGQGKIIRFEDITLELLNQL